MHVLSSLPSQISVYANKKCIFSFFVLCFCIFCLTVFCVGPLNKLLKIIKHFHIKKYFCSDLSSIRFLQLRFCLRTFEMYMQQRDLSWISKIYIYICIYYMLYSSYTIQSTIIKEIQIFVYDIYAFLCHMYIGFILYSFTGLFRSQSLYSNTVYNSSIYLCTGHLQILRIGDTHTTKKNVQNIKKNSPNIIFFVSFFFTFLLQRKC